MSKMITIALPFGCKVKITADAYEAAKKAIRVMACDERVASYAAAPHEGLTSEMVAVIRKRMIASGEIPARAYVRLHGEPCG